MALNIHEIHEKASSPAAEWTSEQARNALLTLSIVAEGANQPVLAMWLRDIERTWMDNLIGPQALESFRRLSPKFRGLGERMPAKSTEALICEAAGRILAYWSWDNPMIAVYGTAGRPR